MTIDLGNGRQVTVSSHSQKTWLSVCLDYGGTTIAMDEAQAFAVAREIIASVRRNRKPTKREKP